MGSLRGAGFLTPGGLWPAAAAPSGVGGVPSPPRSFPGRAGAAQKRPRGCPRPPQAPRAAALKGKARRGIETLRAAAGPRGGPGVGRSPPKVWEALLGWQEEMSQSPGVRTHIGQVGREQRVTGGPTLVTACVLRNGN